MAFHFKRLLKVLEWDPRSYLGPEMYNQWQQSLVEDSLRKERSKARKELRIKKNELKLMKLQRKLHLQQTEEVKLHRSTGSDDVHTRRHSVSSSLFRSDSNEDSFIMNNSETTLREDFGSPGKSQRGLIKGDGTPAIRGLLSRLARTKQASVEKDMDKFSKAEKTVIKHSVSVPNMSSLAGLKTGDNFAIDFKMIQEDSQIAHSVEDDEIQDKGLFV